MMIHHIGVSGGKDSSALLLWAVFESGLPKESLRATFCDTGNEDALTYAHLRLLSETVCVKNGLPPIEWLMPKLQFFELAFKKRRFPSRKAQFCTQGLKLFPTQKWIREREEEGHEVIAMSGKRASESAQRKNTVEREFSTFFGCEQWNPLVDWSIHEVMAIHERHGVPLNPLYSMGARRVGCWPCINCGKREIRLVAKHRPEKIRQIAEWERKFEEDYGRPSTFFSSKMTTKPYRTKRFVDKNGKEHLIAPIDEVVKWAHTSHGGKQVDMFLDDAQGPCWIGYGACE